MRLVPLGQRKRDIYHRFPTNYYFKTRVACCILDSWAENQMLGPGWAFTSVAISFDKISSRPALLRGVGVLLF